MQGRFWGHALPQDVFGMQGFCDGATLFQMDSCLHFRRTGSHADKEHLQIMKCCGLEVHVEVHMHVQPLRQQHSLQSGAVLTCGLS